MKLIRYGLFALLALGCALGSVHVKADDAAGQQTWPDLGSTTHRAHAYVWRGSVDESVTVYVQGGKCWSKVETGRPAEHVYFEVRTPLASSAATISLKHIFGRGTITIIQQPKADNKYTLAFRIDDPASGRGDYRLALDW